MIADANAVGLPCVVIGGFSVMANGFVRATKDSDLLVPEALHGELPRVDIPGLDA